MSTPGCRKQIEDLQKVLAVTRNMEATEDLDALLAIILDRSMELLDAERASLFLYDRDRNELISRIAAGLRELRIPADAGISGETVRTRQTVNVPDAYADARFNREVDRQTGFHTRNILSVPLLGYDGRLVGVLQVLNCRGGAFTEYAVSLAETLAAQAGVALQRATLIRHYVQKQQMERAMRIARDIQLGLLPKAPPTAPGFDIAGFSRPADETGGDIYDFFPLAGGRWMLLVADATGHGIGPALVVAEARAMVRSVMRQGAGLQDALNVANGLLEADLGSARFVTCFVGVLEPEANRLRYASAGHGPLLFYSAAEDAFSSVPATGPPLGVLEDYDFAEVLQRDFAPGDFAAFTTDGFFEAEGPGGEQFGLERMRRLLRENRDRPAEEIIARLDRAVSTFTAGLPQADDLTAVVVRRL